MTPVRSDLYSRVTDQIIAELEAGVRPWVQPWNSRTQYPSFRGLCSSQSNAHNRSTGTSSTCRLVLPASALQTTGAASCETDTDRCPRARSRDRRQPYG